MTQCHQRPTSVDHRATHVKLDDGYVVLQCHVVESRVEHKAANVELLLVAVTCGHVVLA